MIASLMYPPECGLFEGLVGVLLPLTSGQLSSSPFNPRTSRPPVRPIARRFISGGLSVSLLYEFNSVGELLSSLLGVLCCEILFGSSSFVIGPRTFVKLCDGRRPGMEFGVFTLASRNVGEPALPSCTFMSAADEPLPVLDVGDVRLFSHEFEDEFLQPPPLPAIELSPDKDLFQEVRCSCLSLR